ncbi:MAG TPA: DUF2306 domain-containing protein [Actinokineospora sp.]|jgi:uncharacterized membrane protein|nr:DUF2306 domain-containing protein [Actinokineospora sp.]
MTSSVTSKPKWLVPTALIMLSAIPVIAGALRVADLTVGTKTMPEATRFAAMPVPVLLHIVGASLFCVLGAFQFVPKLRRRPWHRVAGRILVPCGLAAALSGVWMTLFLSHPVGDSALLTVFRLGFGSAMAVAIVLSFTAIRRRDIARHRAWMVRAYAIGQGAGSQAVILTTWTVLVGAPGPLANALLMGAAWSINLAVAERLLRAPIRSTPKARVRETR